MLKIAHTLFLLLAFQLIHAQVTVNGKVTDENKLPIGFVTVNLRQGTNVMGSSTTDSAGHYQFKNLKRDSYTLVFKYLAYKDSVIYATLNVDTLINVQLKNIRTLATITVHNKKPIFQREIDRLRFNVAETDLGNGNNIWDVIEKTPLVNVSSDGTIQVSGTSGAVVYINNKRKLLTGAALKNYLSSMPATNLDAIEVMTTPSSKYDAAGGAGIINIVTKKNKTEGFIGNTVLSTRQTAVNSQAGSIFLNNRKGKWNVFSDAYLSNRARKPIFKKDIYYPETNENALLHRRVNTLGDFQVLSPGANLGIDHQVNANNVLGLLFDYAGSWHTETRDATSSDHFKNSDLLSLTNNSDKLHSQTYSLNLNYQGTLDTLGKKISVDFDALNYVSTNNSVSITESLATYTAQPLNITDWFRSAAPQQISNQSAKIDFEWPLTKKISLDLGSKVSFSKINNHLLFENRLAENVWEKDTAKSNLFRYDENINSIYAILNHKANTQWAYQLGIRLENTVAKGWLEGIQAVDRNYINVFPTAFLKYTTLNDKSFVLAVSSRITRPSFWDVNPFRMYTTDQTYFEGNPFLLPSTYYREELSHSLNTKSGTYILQLAAGQSLNEIYALPYNPSGNIIANKKVNYGNKYSFSGSVNYYNQLLPWWKLSGSVLTGYVMSKGAYADQVVIDNKTVLFSISTNQTFNISKKNGLSGTVIANNTFPATIVNTRIANRLETEIRLAKSLGPLNITLSAQDLFKSNKDRYKVNLNELGIIDENYHDTRSVALALSFNFGKSTVKNKRDRDAGYQDVKQRIS